MASPPASRVCLSDTVLKDSERRKLSAVLKFMCPPYVNTPPPQHPPTHTADHVQFKPTCECSTHTHHTHAHLHPHNLNQRRLNPNQVVYVVDAHFTRTGVRRTLSCFTNSSTVHEHLLISGRSDHPRPPSNSRRLEPAQS